MQWHSVKGSHADVKAKKEQEKRCDCSLPASILYLLLLPSAGVSFALHVMHVGRRQVASSILLASSRVHACHNLEVITSSSSILPYPTISRESELKTLERADAIFREAESQVII